MKLKNGMKMRFEAWAWAWAGASGAQFLTKSYARGTYKKHI